MELPSPGPSYDSKLVGINSKLFCLPLAVGTVTTRPPKPRTSSINPPNPQKTSNAPLNFRPCPVPISANSDTFPANSDGPLANFGAFPAATDTYPGPPEPREPPPLFPIFATHHQLNTLVPPTYSGVSR
ncbi:hypothetical protein H2248_002622 [Termitomyces sp. 'cryptogamus']|nr:hypothetical protein H2248_002622 [Termitomyces sp. 'cryptogamus']